MPCLSRLAEFLLGNVRAIWGHCLAYPLGLLIARVDDLFELVSALKLLLGHCREVPSDRVMDCLSIDPGLAGHANFPIGELITTFRHGCWPPRTIGRSSFPLLFIVWEDVPPHFIITHKMPIISKPAFTFARMEACLAPRCVSLTSPFPLCADQPSGDISIGGALPLISMSTLIDQPSGDIDGSGSVMIAIQVLRTKGAAVSSTRCLSCYSSTARRPPLGVSLRSST